MKRIVKRVVGFISIFIVVYGISVVLAGILLPVSLRPNIPFLKGVYGHYHSRAVEAKDYGSVDILVLGSSLAYRGIDPRVFSKKGIRIFNLGSTAQTPIQSVCLAKQ